MLHSWAKKKQNQKALFCTGLMIYTFKILSTHNYEVMMNKKYNQNRQASSFSASE